MLLYTSSLETALCEFTNSNLCNAVSKSHKFGCTISKLRQLCCAILKLVCNFAISSLHSSISKLSKFGNCVEHNTFTLVANEKNKLQCTSAVIRSNSCQYE